MKFMRALMMAGFLAAPWQAAVAVEEVIDYQGNKITLEEGEINNNGVKIHYYTVGKGPLFIISHGNGDFWGGWTHQLHMLSQRYKVVLYDLRNFNKSDKIVGVDKNIDAAFESDLLAVQNHFTDGPAVHMGQDQGGMILWMYAMKHPEKVRLLIQTNAIHPRAFIRELAISEEQRKGSSYIETMVESRKGPPFMVANFNARPGDTPSMTQQRNEATKRTGDDGRQGTIDWYAANFPKKPYTLDSEGFGGRGSDFPQIKVPTLVNSDKGGGALRVAGYNDLASWIDAEYTFVRWPDGSHFQHTTMPERFNKMLAHWLDFYDPAAKSAATK